MTKDAHDNELGKPMRAGELSADQLGQLIRFRVWDPATLVVTIVTAELRQLAIDMTGVTVIYGEQAACETLLTPEQMVILRPFADYRDVALLLDHLPADDGGRVG